MKKNLKKMASYYKPYFGTFMLDLFFAFLASATALVIPLVVRYITSNIANIKADGDIRLILTIGGVLFGQLRIKIFYILCRPCHGCENRIQHAIGNI